MARQFVPYTIDSFTGGITDKVVKPSNPVQYETLKNLIPQRDESLRQRDGFKLWTNMEEDFNILQMFEFQGFVFYYCSDKKFYYIANDGVGVPVVVRTELNSSTYTATSYDGTWHINEIQGELILTHEPSDKTSFVNPADPNGNNPTEYPPLYRRTPLRRIYIDYTGTPRICTAQLPRFTHNGTSFSGDDEIYVVPDDIGNDDISYYEFYWKYSYNILMNNEIVRKEIYGEPTYTTMAALSSNDKNTLYWKEFDYQNRFGSSATNTIYQIARTDQGVVTVTTGTVHGYTAGQSVIVRSKYNTEINGKFIIRTVPSTSSFTYKQENTYTAIILRGSSGITTGVQIVDDRFTDNEMWNVKTHANTEIDAGDCIQLVVALKFVGLDTEYYVRHHNTEDSLAYLYPEDSGSYIAATGEQLSTSYVEQGYAPNQSLILGSYFNTVVEGKPFFGNMSLAPNRVYQGLEDASAWTNIAWFADFSGVLTGLDNFSAKPIAFTSDATYRIEGQKFQDSSGSLYTRTISDSHGCIASRSLVRTQYGLFFWSKSGIFICDGIKVNRISDSLQARYKSWVTTATQKNAVKGWYDDEDDKVYWVVQESNGHTFLLVLDLYFGISSESTFYILDSDHSYWTITDGMLNSYDNKILISSYQAVYQPDPNYTYDALGVVSYLPIITVWETGPSGPSTYAFLGGVLLPNGKVFCVPYVYTGTDTIYNPTTNDWETGPAGPGGDPFSGGVLLPNGKVFCIPYGYTGTQTIYNPTNNVWETGPAGPGSSAFRGGVLLPNGKVFCVPFSYTGTNTIYNPTTNDWETGPAGPGSSAFSGGVLLPNGKVFCVPLDYFGTDTIYNPTTNDWETGPAASGINTFMGGVLLPNGKVFCIPYGYTGTNTIYDPARNAWETGPSGPGGGPFRGGVLLPNGRVFCIPYSYTGTNTIYNSTRNDWETGPAGPGSSAFSGGVLLPNGKVFCVPFGYTGTNTIYDPGPNTVVVAGLNVPIKYDYKSPVITYNDKLGRKWTSHIVLNMKDSNSAAGVSTRIRSYADLSANPHYLDPCFYYQKMYSDNQEWGNIDPVWGESQRPIFKRYFDQSTVRNTFIQIGFDNLKIVRYTDADYGKATYLQTSSLRYLLLPNTLFINSPITAEEALDGSWYIKLEEDDYETEYPITSIQNNSTFLQINLPLNTELTSGSLAQSNHGWKLCQISKEHRFHLLSYSLLYTPMGHRTIPGYQPEKMNGE